jgi:hypothetical protein
MNFSVTTYVEHPVTNMKPSLDSSGLMLQKYIRTDYYEFMNYSYFSNSIRFKFLTPNAIDVTRHSLISH